MARYEHQRPGELCILDIKRFHRLGHTCTATVDSNPRASAGRIDDHAREFYRDERGPERPLPRRLGITIARIRILEWAYLRAHANGRERARLGLSLNNLSALHTQAGLRVRSAGVSPKSAGGHRPPGEGERSSAFPYREMWRRPFLEAHAPSAHARVSGSHFDAPPS